MHFDLTTKRWNQKKDADDWCAQWEEITGEAFTHQSMARRIHENHIAEVVRKVIHGQITTGKFLANYKLRDRHGRYIWVRGHGLFMFGEWIATIERVTLEQEHWLTMTLTRWSN